MGDSDDSEGANDSDYDPEVRKEIAEVVIVPQKVTISL